MKICGGYVDGVKVLEEVVDIWNVELGKLIDSLNCFYEFLSVFEMFDFIEKFRDVG